MDAGARLERVRKFAHDGLRYYGTALLRLETGEWEPTRPKEQEAIELESLMGQLAHVVALVEGAEDPRATMRAREEVLQRYRAEVARDPWSPPDGASGQRS